MLARFLGRRKPVSEPDAPLAIAQHVSKFAISIRNNLWAFEVGRARHYCSALKTDELQQHQEAVSNSGNTCLSLGQVVDCGKPMALEGMVGLWHIQGDAHLFQTIFASDELCHCHSGPDAEFKDLQAQFDICIPRAFVVSANFLFASETHRKGCLRKMFQEGLSEEERGTFQAMREAARYTAAGAAMKMLRPASYNPDRFDEESERQLKLLAATPLVLQVRAEYCTNANQVWMETAHVEKLLAACAGMQAAAYTGASSRLLV